MSGLSDLTQHLTSCCEFLLNHSLDCAKVDLHHQLQLSRGEIVMIFLVQNTLSVFWNWKWKCETVTALTFGIVCLNDETNCGRCLPVWVTLVLTVGGCLCVASCRNGKRTAPHAYKRWAGAALQPNEHHTTGDEPSLTNKEKKNPDAFKSRRDYHLCYSACCLFVYSNRAVPYNRGSFRAEIWTASLCVKVITRSGYHRDKR